MSSFAQGFSAGFNAVTSAKRLKLDEEEAARKKEEYERQKAADEAFTRLQQDRYSNTGAFTPQPVNPDPAAQGMADASYNRAEGVRLGVPQPADGPSLSMTPEQAKSLQPKPLDDVTKDRLYYDELGKWANTHLKPREAVAFQGDIAKMRESDYNTKRLEAFRQATRGNPEGLKWIAGSHATMVPDGLKMDTSEAEFEPGYGWRGVTLTNEKTGKSRFIDLNMDTLAEGFMASDPAQLASFRMKQRELAQGDKRLQIAEDTLIDQQTANFFRRNFDERKFAEDVRQFGERVRLQKEDQRLAGVRVNQEGERLRRDETASDLSKRQSFFTNAFVDMKEPKDPGELASADERAKYEKMREAYEAKRGMANTATALYSMSTEGAAPKSRGAIAAEVQEFVKSYAEDAAAAEVARQTGKPLEARKLDFSKLKVGEDGITRYGRVVVPPSMLAQEQAAPAGAQPTPGVRAAPQAAQPTPGIRPAAYGTPAHAERVIRHNLGPEMPLQSDLTTPNLSLYR